MKKPGYWFDQDTETFHIVYPDGSTQAFLFDTWLTYPLGRVFKVKAPGDIYIGAL